MNYQPLSLRAGEDGCPRLSKENTFALPPPVVIFRLSMNWMMPTDTGEGDILYSVNQLKYYSLPETTIQFFDFLFKISLLQCSKEREYFQTCLKEDL